MSLNNKFNFIYLKFTLIFLQIFLSQAINCTIETENKTKICLCMIVKNESKIILRCLENTKNIINCISICDTGSTDNTIELLENYIKENNIPGKVHKHEWKNFGHNRTLSAQAAKETIIELGFNPENTYFLFIDADMVLKATEEFNKNNLTADYYLLNQINPNYSHYNLRLARASLPWKSIGPTHEYWACLLPAKQEICKTLYIDDLNDGGCKSDKFERDIKLLTEGLIEEPNNERYMFYLAMSYQNLSNLDESIKWYKLRIAMGGCQEEIWYSKLELANCYKAKGDWKEALSCYLDAFQHNPERAEPLGEIALHYRLNSQNYLASIFANFGKKIKYPENQMLFISDNLYKYRFYEDLSISLFYTKFRDKGFKYAEKLIFNKNTPYHVKENSHRNLLFYVENLKNTEFKKIEPDHILYIDNWSSDKFLPCNPTICKTETGYNVICRHVNYVYYYAVSYIILDEEKKVKTKNILIEYDKNFNKISESIIDDSSDKRKFCCNIIGLEDCRIFSWNNQFWFTSNCRETNINLAYQVCLSKLEDASEENKINIKQFIPLVGPDAKRCEKNWLPFIIDNQLYTIYSYDPVVIFRPNKETGECETFINKSQEFDFSRLRGSAPPIEFDNGYLLLVHEVIFKDNRRYYIHRFVNMDKDFNIIKLSRPFTFKHKGPEYCCGMTLDHSGQKLIMSIGIEDREAHLCFVDIDYVKTLLYPLNSLI